jgi:hypothetical protein
MIITIRERRAALATMDADSDVQVVLFKHDGTSEAFTREDVYEHHGRAQLEIEEAENPAHERRASTRERDHQWLTNHPPSSSKMSPWIRPA